MNEQVIEAIVTLPRPDPAKALPTTNPRRSPHRGYRQTQSSCAQPIPAATNSTATTTALSVR